MPEQNQGIGILEVLVRKKPVLRAPKIIWKGFNLINENNFDVEIINTLDSIKKRSILCSPEHPLSEIRSDNRRPVNEILGSDSKGKDDFVPYGDSLHDLGYGSNCGIFYTKWEGHIDPKEIFKKLKDLGHFKETQLHLLATHKGLLKRLGEEIGNNVFRNSNEVQFYPRCWSGVTQNMILTTDFQDPKYVADIEIGDGPIYPGCYVPRDSPLSKLSKDVVAIRAVSTERSERFIEEALERYRTIFPEKIDILRMCIGLEIPKDP